MKRGLWLTLTIVAASSIFAMPVSANYFSNPKRNTAFMIGTVRSPTPEDLRRIGDSNYPPSYRATQPSRPAAPASAGTPRNIVPDEFDGIGSQFEDEDTTASLSVQKNSRVAGAKLKNAKNIASSKIAGKSSATAMVLPKPKPAIKLAGKPVKIATVMKKQRIGA